MKDLSSGAATPPRTSADFSIAYEIEKFADT
jgi:hypothetical protein